MRRSAFLVLLVFARYASGQGVRAEAHLGSGTVTGLVVDEKGTAVEGAVVSLSTELPGAVRGQKRTPFTPFHSIALTAKDGAFSAANLPAGLMKICVQVPNSDFINECLWPMTPRTLTVSAKQQTKLPAISVKKGLRLRIRVDDTAVALPRAGTPAHWPALNLGVFADKGMFVNAHRVGADAAGFDYEVLVPYDLPLHVSASSKALLLADGNGRAGDPLKGIVTPIRVASGTASMAALKVIVSGVKP